MQTFRFKSKLDSSNASIVGLELQGVWDYKTPSKNLKNLKKAMDKNPAFIEFSPDSRIDLTFVAFLYNSMNQEIEIIANDNINKIFNQYKNNMPPVESKHSRKNLFKTMLDDLGKFVVSFIDSFINFFNFVGMSLFYAYRSIAKGEVKLAPLLYHMNESGFRAMPIALASSFIVGFAISLQGAVQLAALGAPLMSIETTAKLSLREMGPFILALIIAGRSASSFTAEIGVMKITDEINAMKTMDFNPVAFLVTPRVLALVLIMPFLVFLADFFALFGGMLSIYIELDIGFKAYVERFYETVGWSHFLIGIIKAPFFGAAIALVGCFRGFCIKADSQELGRYTTISVVNALFWIIAINAIFSFITTRLNV